MRARFPLGLAGFSLALAACAGTQGSGEEVAEQSKSPSAPTSPKATASGSTPTVEPSSKEPVDNLIGFGATGAAWDANHVEARGKQFARGAVYDRDESLPDAVGPYTYTSVTRSDQGRITTYYENFQGSTTSDEAVQIIRRELPDDVTFLWERQFDTCIQIEYRSKTLSKVAESDDGFTGGISVALFNINNDGEPMPDLQTVNSSVVGVGFTDDPADAPPC